MPNVAQPPGANAGLLPLGGNPSILPLNTQGANGMMGALPGGTTIQAGAGFGGLSMSPGAPSGASGGGQQTPIPGLPATYAPYGSFTSPTGSSPNAPTATPYGMFTAPDPSNFQHSPSFQYDMDQAQKAIQKSAAARGTLLTGGTLRSLQGNAIGLASRDYQNAFNNALQAYGTNRDTNAQNFGQRHTAFGDTLAGQGQDFSQAATAYGLNRDTQAQNFAQARELGAFPSAGGAPVAMANPPSGGGPAADYTAAVQQQQALNGRLPGRGGFMERQYRGGYNGLPAQRDNARILGAAGRLFGR